MKKPIIVLASLLLAAPTFAQTSTVVPGYDAEKNVVKVPVAVHIVQEMSAQSTMPSIQMDQVVSQIKGLNEDFNKSNVEALEDRIPQQFQDLAQLGNNETRVEFYLAEVNWVSTNQHAIGQDQTALGQLNDADGNKLMKNHNYYLNMWVANIDNGSTKGFAIAPQDATRLFDGVVTDYRYFGNTQDKAFQVAGYDLGKTVTKQVAHFLGLDNAYNTTGTPAAYDLPAQKESYENRGLELYNNVAANASAGSQDMFMNFMTEARDEVKSLFSKGQREMMLHQLGLDQQSQQGVTSYRSFMKDSNPIVELNTMGHLQLAPAHRAMSVSPKQDLMMQFGEKITIVRGKEIIIRKADDRSEVLRVKSEELARPSDKVISIPVLDQEGKSILSTSTDYIVEVQEGTFLGKDKGEAYLGTKQYDAQGQLIASTSDKSEWMFSTHTNNEFAATEMMPRTGAEHISIMPELSIDLDQRVAPASKHILIKRADNNVVAHRISAEQATRQIEGRRVIDMQELGLALDYGTQYYVEIERGTFQALNEDGSVNTNSQLIPVQGKDKWSFTTQAKNDIVVRTTSPRMGEVASLPTAHNSEFKLDLGQECTSCLPQSGKYIWVKRSSDNKVITKLEATQSWTEGTQKVFTLPYNELLQDVKGEYAKEGISKDLAGQYYIEVEKGAFKNQLTGQDFIGFTGKTWNFQVQNPAEGLMSTREMQPSNGSINVPVNKTFQIQLDETANMVEGKRIFVRKSSDNSLFHTITLDAQMQAPQSPSVKSECWIEGDKVMFRLQDVNGQPISLEHSTEYYIEVEKDAFKSIDGRSLEVKGNMAWSFRTHESTIMTADITLCDLQGKDLYSIDRRSTEGAPFSINMPTQGGIALAINLNEQTDAVQGKKIEIRRADNNQIVKTIDATDCILTPDHKQLVALPAGLDASTKYICTIEDGAFVSRTSGAEYKSLRTDAKHGLVSSDIAWSFMTKPVAGQEIAQTTLFPAHNATNVALNTKLQLELNAPVSLDVQAIEGMERVNNDQFILVRRSSDDKIVKSVEMRDAQIKQLNGKQMLELDLANCLEFNQDYYVQVPQGAFVKSMDKGIAYQGIGANSDLRDAKQAWTFSTAASNTNITVSSLHSLSIAPNPAKNFVRVDYRMQLAGISEQVRLEVSDLNGQIIPSLTRQLASQERGIVTMNVSNLPVGTYMMQIRGQQSGQVFIAKQLIKQ